MTSFQFTTMSIPTVEKDQFLLLKNPAFNVVILAIHERGEIRACESVKVGGWRVVGGSEAYGSLCRSGVRH